LAVPTFQRNYSWTTEQVEAFWQDLRAALVAEQPLYFLGTVVLSMSDDNRATVIDGQQRLATTSMLFAAIRNLYLRFLDEERARVIENAYVMGVSLHSAEPEPRLELNSSDNEFFKKHVLARAGGGETESDRRSHELIIKAFRVLTERLAEDVESSGPHWADRLRAWVRLLDEDARIIVVRVRDDADAFLIFETLNDRGLELTIADVIKNYLFGLARNDITQAERHWTSAARALEEASSGDITTTFLRQWWTARYGATRERELYRAMRGVVRDPVKSLEVLSALEDAAPLFAATLDAQHDFWAHVGRDSRAAMESLLRFGLEQVRPLLLAAAGQFAPTELERLLRALVCWSARGIIVGGIGGGTTERYYAEAAVRVSNARVNSVEGVLQDLDNVVASDSEFESVFTSRRVTRTAYAKYFLLALAKEVDGAPTPALVREAEESGAALVRVAPRRDDEDLWDRFDPDQINGWATRLGNLVLVDPAIARKLPDDPGDRIAALQGEHPIRNIRPISNSWEPADIEARQHEFAAIAVRTWPRRPHDGD
jgi:hypothetical protein